MAMDMTYFDAMEAKIPHGKIRTRFAPSPTGYMHVGNLRTALYTWLIARNGGGTFILRIEDTDQGRLVEGATDVIYRTMAECGLTHDEGPDVGGPVAPYIQSERRDTYGKYARLGNKHNPDHPQQRPPILLLQPMEQDRNYRSHHQDIDIGFHHDSKR